ncbi:Secreted RxLR effector protein 161 [Anthophora plagiata]
MEINLKLEQSELNEEIKYRNLIGALLYISSGTTPNVFFSVNYLSRFQNCCSETHFKYLLRVLKYLYLTRNLKLTYTQNETDLMDCFVDADWAGDIVDRKSTTGFVIRVYGNTIYWKSKKQKVHYHFVHENCKNGTIEIIKVNSEENIADIFTKALGNIKFAKFRSSLMLL